VKKILNFIIEPFKFIGSRKITEKLGNLINKYKIIHVLLSLIIAVLIVGYIYAKSFYGW